jgi:flagellar biosynthesis chaperone FliJ
MSKSPQYPLEQLILIKQKRLEEAEKVLKEKKTLLENEEKKLKEFEQQRDEIKKHKEEKQIQLKEALDTGTTSTKILQMQQYIQIVQEKYIVRERKVQDQKKNVDIAKKNVDIAREAVFKKQQEIEKMHLHKKEWKKEVTLEQLRQEGIETDELGSQVHTLKKSQNPFTQSLKKNKS